jgi:hypothetical protein
MNPRDLEPSFIVREAVFREPLLSRLATNRRIRRAVRLDVAPAGEVSRQSMEESKAALRELGSKEGLA